MKSLFEGFETHIEELKEIQSKIDNQTASLDDFYRKEALMGQAHRNIASHLRCYGICWRCGGNLYWENDFSTDEVFGDGRNGITTFLSCADCGENVISTMLDNEEE